VTAASLTHPEHGAYCADASVTDTRQSAW